MLQKILGRQRVKSKNNNIGFLGGFLKAGFFKVGPAQKNPLVKKKLPFFWVGPIHANSAILGTSVPRLWEH